MSDMPFHLTRSGRTFYESTMPALVRELARLNENFERLTGQQPERPAAPLAPDSAADKKSEADR